MTKMERQLAAQNVGTARVFNGIVEKCLNENEWVIRCANGVSIYMPKELFKGVTEGMNPTLSLTFIITQLVELPTSPEMQ